MDPKSPARAEVDVAVETLTKRLQESRLAEADLRARFKALMDTLVASGEVSPEDYERRRQIELTRELGRLRERPLVELEHPHVDKYNIAGLPQIDCASIIPICEARCCRLRVTLSRQDLDERQLTWDYARPYVLLRRESDGYCAHSVEKTHGCNAYEHRPVTCRVYDCRDDRRIWIDFEKRQLAEDEGQFHD